MGTNTDNIWSHFNELALAVLLLALVGIDVHMIHRGVDDNSIVWVQGIAGQILAALLALMVKSPAPPASKNPPDGGSK